MARQDCQDQRDFDGARVAFIAERSEASLPKSKVLAGRGIQPCHSARSAALESLASRMDDWKLDGKKSRSFCL